MRIELLALINLVVYQDTRKRNDFKLISRLAAFNRYIYNVVIINLLKNLLMNFFN